MKQDELRALTLWRPWPYAIFYGGKRIENRPWKPWASVIGRYIALHAGMKYDNDGAVWMLKEKLYVPPSPSACPAGGFIVGVARVTGYVHVDEGDLYITADAFKEFWDQEALDSPWFFGPYGWTLDNIRRFTEPVACKGAQGLWPVMGETLDEVRAAYREGVDCQ